MSFQVTTAWAAGPHSAHWLAAAVNGTDRGTFVSPEGRACSLSLAGLRDAAAPWIVAALFFGAPAPVPLPGSTAAVLGLSGSAPTGPLGSGFMMLTAGIDAADGKNISGRNGRPGEGRLPFGREAADCVRLGSGIATGTLGGGVSEDILASVSGGSKARTGISAVATAVGAPVDQAVEKCAT